MKYIITENQNNSLKSNLTKIKKELGMAQAIKVVGGINNYANILYGSDIQGLLDELFDPMFEGLKMKRRYHNWYAFDWIKDGNIVIQRDNNGTLFIFGPEEYNEMTRIKKLVEPIKSFPTDIKDAMGMYLNKRYEEEFEGHPIIINHIWPFQI